MAIILNLVGTAKIKKKDICIFRDQHGKFYAKNDEITTQKKLNAAEAIRYLLHIANEEM